MTGTNDSSTIKTGVQARRAARDNSHQDPTAHLAPHYLQANLVVLPSRYADDFRLLCKRNPVPCPLLAESSRPGSATSFKSHLPTIPDSAFSNDIDIRTDAPKYVVFKDGKVVKSHVSDIKEDWTDDHVAFLIGCSFSFETALEQAGLPPSHALHNRIPPVYKVAIPLLPAGAFVESDYLVSMRPYRKSDLQRVRDITRIFETTHGCPVAWGWDAAKRLGIKDINKPDYGHLPIKPDGGELTEESAGDLIPVFWGCGVTPQEAVARANLDGICMSHATGYMIVLDLKDDEVFDLTSLKSI